MRILVTGSNSLLGVTLVKTLAPNNDVRTLDVVQGTSGPPPTYMGDVRDRALAAQAVQGCDAIIHIIPSAPDGSPPEEALDVATRGTYNLVTTATADRFVLLTSLRIFESYPMAWRVTEHWAPRPTTAVPDLASYLAELTVREVARVRPMKAMALRLGDVVDDETMCGRSPDPRWLHVEDAAQAVERALAFAPTTGATAGWWVFHIVGGGRRTRFPLGLAAEQPFGYTPRHDLTAGVSLPAMAEGEVLAPSHAQGTIGTGVRRVVIFGAASSLSAITVEALVRDHILRLTDVAPLAEVVAQSKPHRLGAPVPRLLDAPHEIRVVDVADSEQVLDAARGMDAIINCAVVRRHEVEAFRVNVLGAYNIMRAAIACGIRRIVHTGPQLVAQVPFPAGYWHDFAVPADVPPRPGITLYRLSKFLGQEICRIFAQEHDLDVPCVLFREFVNTDCPANDPLGVFPFSVSWEDAAEAMRRALRAPSFPHPFEVFHITADLPHGMFANEKAKRLLGWQPRDSLQKYWLRDLD